MSSNGGNDTGSSSINQADMSIEDRYYNREEYAKLSNAKKLGLKRKREKRGGGPSKKRGINTGGRSSDTFELSKRSIKALATAVAAAKDDSGTTKTESCSEGSDDDEAPASKKQKNAAKNGNRGNTALTRKRS